MPHVVKDRVMETTASTGTGTITLTGAVAGYQSFSVIGNANTTYYTISGGTEWEVGIGTYTSSGTTLSRDTVLESSNGGSLVNFSAGTKNVFVTYPAEESVDQDTAMTLTNKTISGANNTITNVSLTAGVTGTLPIANGGTGESNRQSAMDALAGSVTSGQYLRGNGTDVVMSAIQAGDVPTLNQNTTGSAARAPEWQGSGNTGNWNSQFQDTEARSATQIDINGGTSCPTGGGWWFAESFRHSNSSNFWGTQYAHGWEDRAYQRWVRNVSSNNFGSWQLDVGCRAWVNFNGSNGGIRASGNVSSVTFFGNGNYGVNFSVGMLDTNYSVSGGGQYDTSNVNADAPTVGIRRISGAMNTTSVRITINGNFAPIVTCVSIHR